MNKKLIAKAQKLTAKIPDKSPEFSNSFVMEPEDASLLERYGTLYVVYEVDGGVDLDTLLVTKLVHDVLYDTYFHSENSSPIQSLEKSVLNLKDKLMGFYQEQQALEVSISIIVSVLWGNVLYIVQFGSGNSYLMREGELKTINAASEGNFSVASGVVKDDDVVILGTKSFLTKHPVSTLISSAATISVHALPYGASALILKFTVDTTFSKDEVLDIKSDTEKIYTPSNASARSFSMPSVSITNKIGAVLTKLKPTGKAMPRGLFKKLGFGVLGLLLLGIVAYSLKTGLAGKEKILPKPPIVSKNAVEGASSVALDNSPVDTSKDAANKIQRITPELFYDLQLADTNANPSSIVALADTLVVADFAKGAVYTSNVDVPKFVQSKDSYAGLKQIFAYGGNLGVVDSSGLTLVDLAAEDQTSSQIFEGAFGKIAVYLDFLYSLNASDGTITKYTLEDTALTNVVWGTFPELVSATSHSINVSIYVLDANSALQVYTQGEKDAFEITGLSVPLRNASQVFTSEDLDSIYIADKGNNRIIVLDDEGNLLKQFQATDRTYFNDIRSIVVNAAEDTLFVLDGSKVYQIKL